MVDRIKLGIVGCGAGGTQAIYAPILRLLQKGVVTALCDPDPNALDFMVQNYGDFDCYQDYGAFLARADVEAVLIASPVFLHADQTIQAARAGKHILCEKPLALTIEECDRVLETIEKQRVTLMVGFVRRFDKSLQLAKSLLEQGKLGRLFHIRAETSWCHDISPLGFNWRQSIRTLGGIFQDNASHIVDLCRWWAGEVQIVSGEALILRPHWEVETHAHATLRHESGVISTIHVSNNSHRPMTEYFLLEGTEAALEIQFGPSAKYSSPETFIVHLWEGGTRRTDLTSYNYGNLDQELSQRGMFKNELDHFCECLLKHKIPELNGDVGRKATEVINAVYLSCAHGQKIHLPLNNSGNLKQIFRNMQLEYR